jgi:hypothetical protein
MRDMKRWLSITAGGVGVSGDVCLGVCVGEGLDLFIFLVLLRLRFLLLCVVSLVVPTILLYMYITKTIMKFIPLDHVRVPEYDADKHADKKDTRHETYYSDTYQYLDDLMDKTFITDYFLNRPAGSGSGAGSGAGSGSVMPTAATSK